MSGAFFIATTWDDKPTYWPSMVSAYLIATTVLLYRYRKNHEKTSLWQELFPRNVWLHQTTLQDIAMTFITFIMMSYVLYHILINPVAIVNIVYSIMDALPFSQSKLDQPPWGAIALYVFMSMLASDFFYYISHKLSHEIPVLWEFHKVHHSGKVLTPLTVYRIHPLDSWWNQCFRNIGAGIIAGVFFYFYPSQSSMFVIALNLIGTYSFHFVAANIRHTHIWISFGPMLEHIFISPAQHQIHHSDNPKHFDKNYGSVFSLWDWLFGSLYIPKEKEELTFGLGHNPHDEEVHGSLWKMYIHPLINFAKWVKG
jgi:sterol desaturase/sphingolipid hydroxylase (fatty acid hydroxylase superfamily)